MSHKCEHGKDSDVCVQCWEDKNTDRQLNMPISKTPRTDAFEVETDMQDLSIGHKLQEWKQKTRQLEKELNEAKAAIQLMDTGKYGRAELVSQRNQARNECDQLTSRLEASEAELKRLKNDEH